MTNHNFIACLTTLTFVFSPCLDLSARTSANVLMESVEDVRNDAQPAPQAEPATFSKSAAAVEPAKAVLTPDTFKKMGMEASWETPGSKMMVLVLNDGATRFNTGQTEINETAASQLKSLAAALKEFGYPKIRIDGHADRRGGHQINKLISRRRAMSVYRALRKDGVADKVIVATNGWSYDKPLVEGTGPEVWGRNRRVEVRILTQGDDSQLSQAPEVNALALNLTQAATRESLRVS